MPLDTAKNYQYPEGTRGIPNETIESAAYNSFIDDLRDNDLNKPRPIHRGGTNAITADGALVNLSGEKSTQVVTNFDSHVWFPGSFRSTNTTGQAAPIDGHAFSGISYIHEPLANPPTNQNVTVSARDMTDGKVYVRIKTAGVWASAWIEQAGSLTIIRDYVNSAFVASVDFPSSGMQINGSMEVSQERGTTPYALDAAVIAYIVDGVAAKSDNPIGTAVVAQMKDTLVSPLPGFNSSVYMNCVTPNASPLSRHHQWIAFPLEGYRVARLGFGTSNARSVSIGFWIFSTAVTGNMAVAILNGARNRNYVVDVPVTAGAWQYKTVTIYGDSVGTWAKDQNLGMTVYLCFGTGSDYVKPTNTWSTGEAYGSPATTNFFAIAGAVHITGVTIMPGTLAPTAEQSPMVTRSYDEELLLCQRYWQKIKGVMTSGYNTAGQAVYSSNVFPTTMRVAPSPSFSTVAYTNSSTLVDIAYTIDAMRSGITIVTTGVGYAVYDVSLNSRML